MSEQSALSALRGGVEQARARRHADEIEFAAVFWVGDYEGWLASLESLREHWRYGVFVFVPNRAQMTTYCERKGLKKTMVFQDVVR